jgi:hypothetical protein
MAKKEDHVLRGCQEGQRILLNTKTRKTIKGFVANTKDNYPQVVEEKKKR